VDNTDKIRFCDLWKTAYAVVNAKEPSGMVLDAIFDLLKGYPFELIKMAVEYHASHSEFVIKPVNVVNFIKQATAQSAEQMKNRANKFFDTLITLDNCDTVIENNYFAYAFSECFGTVKAFFMRSANEFSISRDREAFTATVVNALSNNLDVSHVPHVFEGRRNFKDLIRLQFCGDYAKCKLLADNYYLNDLKYKGFKFDYPQIADTNMRLENKQTPQKITDQQKQNQVALLDNVIKKLTQTQ
jgi:hypothetical protein